MSDSRTAAIVTAATDVVALASGDLAFRFAPGAVDYGPATVVVPGRAWMALVVALATPGDPPAGAPAVVEPQPSPIAPGAHATVG